MSTVNFSVPEEVKQAFDAAFAGRNKSAIVAQLMREAVEQELQRRASQAIVERIIEDRKTAPVRSAAALRRARVQGRA
jgi:hypothetical protein